MKTPLLDPEMKAFIARYQAASSLSSAAPVAQQRRDYEQLVKGFSHPIPLGVQFQDSIIDGRHGPISLRHYQATKGDQDARILFIHGGGFILGSLDSHHDLCAELCDQTGFELVSVGYRLAPEHLHPVPLDDIEDAFRSIGQSKTILLGVSAGGTLAAGLCERLKSSPQQPAGQLLIYPTLGGDLLNLNSYQENAEAPLLSTTDVEIYHQLRRANGKPTPTDAEFYPLLAKTFDGLPPTIAISAEIDPLRDDCERYIAVLKQAGTKASWINELGLTHDFLRARHTSTRAGEAFKHICAAIIELVKNGS